MIITLGDYVDRGPDSKGVLDLLIDLHANGCLIPLRGNHESMMLDARSGTTLFSMGDQNLESYGSDTSLKDIPERHWKFISDTCRDWYESESHLFVHANLDPSLSMIEQKRQDLHWKGIGHWHQPHISGKKMICGHTQQPSGVPLNLDSAICIDTGACFGGWLTCLDVTSEYYWQANEKGETRIGVLTAPRRASR